MEKYTLLNTLRFTYPANCSVALNLIKHDKETRILTIPSNFSKGIYIFGALSLLGVSYYLIRKPLICISQWFRTIGNAKRILTIEPSPKKKQQKVYVVVYGARNHGSRAFCTYLAELGYSLIIIDSDQNSLNSAEKHVLKNYEGVSIMKVKMDEFDEEEVLRIVKQLNKFGDAIKGIVITKNVMLNDQHSKKFEGLNYSEIHQIMHDNNEMMVGLVNVLIKSIHKTGNGFIVNLRNSKYATREESVENDLLYYSTSKFSKIFLECLHETDPGIRTINVSVNYESIKEESEKKKLCRKSFDYLGICESITY